MALPASQMELPLTGEDQTPNPRPGTPVPAVRRQLEAWGATPLFDAYWRFAAARQDVLVRRLAGHAPPWTYDPVLARHRFTNPYRFSDRVSQYLIREVQYGAAWDARSLVLRTLLFKMFNRIDTWELLTGRAGEPNIANFDVELLASVLGDAKLSGQRIYSAAYIVPNPPFGQTSKHANHLHMLAMMLESGVIDALATAGELRALFEILIRVPSLGPFLAFQYAVDINYTEVTSDDEWDFVVAGPGARAGIRKCFSRVPRGAENEVIEWVAATQNEHLKRLDLEFAYLYQRDLRPIDCQNLFCEIDKYARVRYPEYSGGDSRTRIKQGFRAEAGRRIAPLVLPPKWVLETPRSCSEHSFGQAARGLGAGATS